MKNNIIKFEIEEQNDSEFVEKIKREIKFGTGYSVVNAIQSIDKKIINYTDYDGVTLLSILKNSDMIHVYKFLIRKGFIAQ